MITGISTEVAVLPEKILLETNITNSKALFYKKPLCVSLFGNFSEKSVIFSGKSSLLIDFGKELNGGIRIITTNAPNNAYLHIVFGESVSEVTSKIGEKNSTNDHSPRDISVLVTSLSDLTFGQTGFRFVLIENLGDEEITLQSISAVNRYSAYPDEGFIKTDDIQLNKILDTAAYTMRLCCQDGYIFDGIKRDRLVWSGDLHQEILTAMYLFGDIENVPNSLEFLRLDSKTGEWINNIPAYSAWWIINLCTYCNISGNFNFFNKHSDYAEEILTQFNSHISGEGVMDFGDNDMRFFLDWQTKDTSDAIIGTAMIILLAARSFLEHRKNAVATEICGKLSGYVTKSVNSKQALAFQVLSGRNCSDVAKKIEKDGSEGFSTFMAYYILSADAKADSKNIIPLIKEYFGAMLLYGATTFWEDFNIKWCENSFGIDEFPSKGKRDIHGDFGDYFYKGLRHSLCHGWSSGVYAFFVEYVLGVKIENGKLASINPRLSGISNVEAEIPLADNILHIDIKDGSVEYYYI